VTDSARKAFGIFVFGYCLGLFFLITLMSMEHGK
jgi:hypothetical protein